MTDVDVEGTSVGVESSCQEFNTDKTIVDSGEGGALFCCEFDWLLMNLRVTDGELERRTDTKTHTHILKEN